ncbi:MAG: hypothetical protein WCJ07_12730, partial [Verrucomicrobiota bacterium]
MSAFKPGDSVYTAGSYAEFALCQLSQVHRLPASVSFPQGAAIVVPYASTTTAVSLKDYSTVTLLARLRGLSTS